MKKAVIMIGLPGSGKSTRTQNLIDNLLSNETYAVHSTDTYHMVEGVYTFNPKALGYYHKLNLEAFCKSIDKKIDLVISDNTNIKACDRKRYVEYANNAGYEVSFEIVGEFNEKFANICAERNVHGVPLDTILRMAKAIQLPETKQINPLKKYNKKS